ncbi:Ca2+-binding protein [Spraguea lophii 42_110]|uniref:Ca2+-binding protein n=1 Tax=Spraguea lophii (strain 42_110) TaxID=1358809 RepID=S7W4Q4_SPRLO|nr:Ca2+-binding protein [Spraguea lophii 42_110]
MALFSFNFLSEEEIDDLVRTTLFTSQEIEYLYERFKLLDRSNQGYIGYDDFIMLPEFHSNPMNINLVKAIEKYTKYNRITFALFLDVLKVFNGKSDKNKRIDFVFECFNTNNNGIICKDILLDVYVKLTGEQFDKTRARDAVNEVLTTYAGRKIYLDKQDFIKFYEENNLDEIFIVNFSKNLSKRKGGFWW